MYYYVVIQYKHKSHELELGQLRYQYPVVRENSGNASQSGPNVPEGRHVTRCHDRMSKGNRKHGS
jgi:hypothetical protein